MGNMEIIAIGSWTYLDESVVVVIRYNPRKLQDTTIRKLTRLLGVSTTGMRTQDLGGTGRQAKL